MKSFKIVTIVVSLHLLMAGMLVLQSGCNSFTGDGQKVLEYDTVVKYEDSEVFSSDLNSGFALENRDMPIGPQASPNNEGRKPTRPVWNIEREGKQGTKSAREATNVKKPKREIIRPIIPIDESETIALADEADEKSSVLSKKEIYTVKAGDSLWKIAKKKGVTVAELLSANHIDENTVLMVGQKLIVPQLLEGGSSSFNLRGYSPSVATPTEGGRYKIKNGDSLSLISEHFGVAIDDIKRANNMRSHKIIAGKTIIIPGLNDEGITQMATFSDPKLSVMPNDGTIHMVKGGETLSLIAMQYGVEVADIMTWNQITDARKLRAGQNLVIRVVSSQPAAPGHRSTHSSAMTEKQSTATDIEMDELFEDDTIFDLSEEIPVVKINES